MQVGCGGIAGSSGHARLHCNENPIYEFPEKELRGLSPSFLIQGLRERFIYSQDRSTYFPAAD